MAQVLKCSKCGVYEKDSNGDPVESLSKQFCLRSANFETNRWDGSLEITFNLPNDYNYSDLCGKCFTKMMLIYIPLIAEIFAPYVPSRVSGFNQGVAVEQEEQLTRDELAVLKVLSQRLLKA